MSIPPRFLDEIRNRLSLSEIIGRRIKVERAGREYKACCPFHKEKTPSFTINDDKQFYHCFGCGAHGDVIGFTMQHDNLSFIDAVEMLAADAGLQMPKPDPEAVQKAEKARGLHELMDEATVWMQAQVDAAENKDILEYLEGRGMNSQARDQFRIGYAPADGQALRKVLEDKGFSDEQMLEAGLLKKSTKGGDPYIFFRDRVMFPVADRRGRVVAFGGRILPENIRPQKGDFTPPKYINSSDTPLFDKGRMLYAETMARQAGREGHTLIVTEGYMDVIACHMAGFRGAVAPMGTALTEDQILSLWSMVTDDDKVPVLCFDGDNAGRSAASRACKRVLPLLKPGRTVRFAFLPDGEDPDSLLRSGGRKGLQKILSSSLSLFDFLWATHTAGRSFETPEARAGLSKDLQKQISTIADPDIQRHYKELIRTKISDTFFTPYKKNNTNAPRRKKSNPAAGMRLRPPVQKKNVLVEKILLAAVINHPHLYEKVSEEFGQFEVTYAPYGNLRHCVIDAMENDPDLDGEALKSKLHSEGFEQEIGDILSESVYVHAAFCRPHESGEDQKSEMIANWHAVLGSTGQNALNKEVRDGWKAAFVNSSEEEEEKLKDLMRIKNADTA